MSGCAKCAGEHKGCTAHNTAGLPCGKQPMKGQRTCRSHGAAAPRAREAGARRVAEQEADKAVRKLFMDLDAEPISNPYPPLQRLTGQVASAVESATERINEWRSLTDLTPLGVEVLRQEVFLVERFVKILAGLLVEMAKLGIEERMAAISEKQGALMAEFIRAVLADPRLDVTAPQDVQHTVVREQFALMRGTG